MIKAILFDFDETLSDRRGSLIDFLTWQANGMLKSEISDVDAYVQRFIELDNNGALWKDQVYHTLIQEFSIKHWSVEDLLNSYWLCFCAFCKPKPGAIEAVQSISESNRKIGLVTNGFTIFQERNFRALGISHLFDEVIVSESVGSKKPDPVIFETVCCRLNVQPSECIFVGDNPIADIEGANRVGMHTIYIPSHFGNACEQANATCRDFKTLTSIIERIS